MKRIILTVILTGMLSAAFADGILSQSQRTRLFAKPRTTVYDRMTADGMAHVKVQNVSDGGFVLTCGGQVIGYSDTGSFYTETAPPAMLDLLEALHESPSTLHESPSTTPPVQPLLGDIAWNQDSPYNDLCPKYDMSNSCPTGCVATAMAQLMRYHRWPQQGTGAHSYEPAVMSGNTLSADFGATTYQWDAMLPNYATATSPADGYTMEECRAAVAVLMQHCGIAVDMVYYTQSGATDYDVPPALTTYFGYDRGMAYRKREHYGTADWLQIIRDDLAEGRPVLAYGRSTSSGHAYVFDGMDDQGFIHVNWGWGGMSNGYFQTSALTPPTQGIGGSDGGFNYSQRIITGIRPADGTVSDYDVELTSTEGLTVSKSKIAQGASVTIRLSGKVTNHGWRDADFDYALLLVDADGQVVRTVSGPASQSLAKDATDYAPTFGTVNLGTLPAGNYTLYPACRMTGGTGPWLRIRDNYISYVNRLDVTATDAEIAFHQPDYFRLKATDVEVPTTIYSGTPTLIIATVSNEGDVEYHGEVKAQLRQGSSIVSTTSNYIIDLLPGATVQMRFTDGFKAAAGDYQLCLVDDDGAVISSRLNVSVQSQPATGTVMATQPIAVSCTQPEKIQVTATVTSQGGFFGGLLYTFIYSEDGRKEMGSLFPEYILLGGDGTTQQVTMTGTLENGIPGTTYQALLAVYDGSSYTFLTDAHATQPFVLDGTSGIDAITLPPSQSTLHSPRYTLSGCRVGNDRQHGIIVTRGKKIMTAK